MLPISVYPVPEKLVFKSWGSDCSTGPLTKKLLLKNTTSSAQVKRVCDIFRRHGTFDKMWVREGWCQFNLVDTYTLNAQKIYVEPPSSSFFTVEFKET